MSENTGISFAFWAVAWVIGFALLPAWKRAKQRRAHEGGGADRERSRRWWLWLNSVGTIGLGAVFLCIGLAFAYGDWRRARFEARMDAIAVSCTGEALSIQNHGRQPVGVDVELVSDEEGLSWMGDPPLRRHRPHTPEGRVDLGPGEEALWSLGGEPMCVRTVFVVGSSKPCATVVTLRLSGDGWSQQADLRCDPSLPQR